MEPVCFLDKSVQKKNPASPIDISILRKKVSRRFGTSQVVEYDRIIVVGAFCNVVMNRSRHTQELLTSYTHNLHFHSDFFPHKVVPSFAKLSCCVTVGVFYTHMVFSVKLQFQ
jgi:hypothetical protein